MALPDLVLATENDVSDLVGARAGEVTQQSDREDGGIALSDTSEGHLYQEWRTTISGDNTQILLEADNSPQQVVYTGVDISEVSLTFDQNMRPTFSFVEGGVAKLYWYDSALGDFTTTSFGSSVFSPRVILDDKRVWQMQYNDILLFYVSSTNLYVRQQRDRFGVEYDMGTLPPNTVRIQKVAFGANYRIHIVFILGE